MERWIIGVKVVLLAGGFGTRISEESYLKPKPMIEIGGKPILWHIMKLYSYYGYNDFIICAGYKQYIIKEWFANFYLYNSDITFNLEKMNEIVVHNNISEPWRVTVVDTGLTTQTGGRIKRVQKYIGNEVFFLTYGDGVSNVNINELFRFHKMQGGVATMTVVQPDGRFGIADIENEKILSFREKNKEDMGWINGGFMVLEPTIFDYIEDDEIVFEKYPLEKLAEERVLNGYKHYGFWQCMDNKRDKEKLEMMWGDGSAPWKVW